MYMYTKTSGSDLGSWSAYVIFESMFYAAWETPAPPRGTSFPSSHLHPSVCRMKAKIGFDTTIKIKWIHLSRPDGARGNVGWRLGRQLRVGPGKSWTLTLDQLMVMVVAEVAVPRLAEQRAPSRKRSPQGRCSNIELTGKDFSLMIIHRSCITDPAFVRPVA